MHELAITQSILEIALRHAQGRNATRITELHLVLGEWSSMIDDSVQFYWDTISAGTIASGARLHFRRVPVELQCQECCQTYRPANPDLFCPYCLSPRVKVLHGEEFYLESIDVETGEACLVDHPAGAQT